MSCLDIYLLFCLLAAIIWIAAHWPRDMQP